MSYGVGLRNGSDLELLWLWPRLAAAALIGPLAWKLPYAIGVALKSKKKTMKIKVKTFVVTIHFINSTSRPYPLD